MRWIKVDKAMEILISLRWYPENWGRRRGGEGGVPMGWRVGRQVKSISVSRWFIAGV
jgi:hypothetical protein